MLRKEHHFWNLYAQSLKLNMELFQKVFNKKGVWRLGRLVNYSPGETDLGRGAFSQKFLSLLYRFALGNNLGNPSVEDFWVSIPPLIKYEERKNNMLNCRFCIVCALDIVRSADFYITRF